MMLTIDQSVKKICLQKYSMSTFLCDKLIGNNLLENKTLINPFIILIFDLWTLNYQKDGISPEVALEQVYLTESV